MKTFLHSGDLGDVIYALPSIKALGGGMVYMTQAEGTREPMTHARIAFLAPLLAYQPYILGVHGWSGQTIDHNFTGFREIFKPGMNTGHAQAQYIGADADFDSPWICAPEGEKRRKVIYSRTPRYRNPDSENLWKHWYREYGMGYFVGLESEWKDFDFGPTEYLPVANALQLASVISACHLFIGNQSLPYSLAEAMKKDSILEVYPDQPDGIYPRENAMHVTEGLKLFVDRLDTA